jgi:hypothetical protein
LILGVVLVAGVVLFLVNPVQCWWLPSCAFHKLTGLYCPGCGSTRAIHALLHGDVASAARFNILAVCGLPALGLIVLWRRAAIHPVVGWTALGVAVLFGILRNIPLESLQVLRP